MKRYLNATDSNELNSYNIQSSFSFFDDSDYQKKIEQVQQPFRVEKSNAWHNGTFVYGEHYQDWTVTFTQKVIQDVEATENIQSPEKVGNSE